MRGKSLLTRHRTGMRGTGARRRAAAGRVSERSPAGSSRGGATVRGPRRNRRRRWRRRDGGRVARLPGDRPAGGGRGRCRTWICLPVSIGCCWARRCALGSPPLPGRHRRGKVRRHCRLDRRGLLAPLTALRTALCSSACHWTAESAHSSTPRPHELGSNRFASPCRCPAQCSSATRNRVRRFRIQDAGLA